MGRKKRTKPHKLDCPRVAKMWAAGCDLERVNQYFECDDISDLELKIRLISLGGVTEEDLPDDPCARCGYLFLNTDWIFGLFGKTDPMTPACKLHDELYAIGPEIGMSRLEADNHFRDAMVLLTNKEIGRKREFMQKQTKVYYGIVRSTGWLLY